MAQQPTSPSYPPDIAGEITSSASKEFVLRKRLFIGGLAAAESAAFLREERVTHVLSVAGGALDVCIGGGGAGSTAKAGDLIDQQAIAHKTVDVVDHPSASILAVLDDALAFLDEAMGPREEAADARRRDGSSVLVHCASGVSRSATAVAAWLMARHGLSLEEALGAVKDGRPQANPNLGFVKQLQLLEQELRAGCDEQVPPCARAAIARAGERWSRDTAPDAMAEARRQREAANELHRRADALEVEASKLASGSSAPAAAGGSSGAPAPDAKSRLHAALEILQAEMDSCLPSEADGFVDRPARMILKSASSKTARLLAALES